MDTLFFALFLASLAGCVAGLISLLHHFFKHQPKKRVLSFIAGSFILMLGSVGAGAAFGETHELTTTKDSYITNTQGIVIIEGTTNEKSSVTIAGDDVENDGSFSYEYQLPDEETQEITVKSLLNDDQLTKKIKVKASDSYLAYLEEQQEKERLSLAQTSLENAEERPNQSNYDEAYTRIQALTQNQPELDRRLAIVAKHLPIIAKVEHLEQSRDKKDLEPALAAVADAQLQKDDLQTRVQTIKKEIHEREKREQLIAAADKAVQQAEKTNKERDYQVAVKALDALPEADNELNERLETVHEKIEEHKVLLAKQAEEKKKKEQAAAERVKQEKAVAVSAAKKQEGQIQAAYQANEQEDVGQTVYVTRTGSKYHTHKCGNGTFTPDSLTNAKARGLTACSKCF